MSDTNQTLNKLETSVKKMGKAVWKLKCNKFPSRNQEKAIKVLNKYVELEDFILNTLQDLSQLKTTEMKILKDLDKYIDKFNEYGSDFQDTWDEDLWNLYEEIRKKKLKNNEELKDESSSTVSSCAVPQANTLQEVDELSRKYIFSISTPRPELHTNSCCRCALI
jgi:hypothetical protein